MKILLVHNYYGSTVPSGENQVFELEKALLERSGQEVREFVRHSDVIRARGLVGLVEGAMATPWNPWTVGEVRRMLAAGPADVVHVHNTFPLISPSIFPAVGVRAARVLTLHNYRLFCPAGIPLREGKPCTQCLDRRSVLPAVRHACYRSSRAATLPLAMNVALQRTLRLWERHLDAFIALTDFQRELMVAAGLPASRVWVKPNFYPGLPRVVPWNERRECVVFAGRLTDEKGVAQLVEAWITWGEHAPELRIVGNGALRGALEARARALSPGRVTFLGQVSPSRAEAEIASAKLLVLPSVCFEGFPMVLREAFAFGTPAAVSDVGPLPRIVQDGRTGIVFKPNDPHSLLQKVRAAWDDTARLAFMSGQARLEYEGKYAEAANYQMLMEIYERAIAVQRERVGA